MSTLAIPPKRVRLYRSLWDRWIIVLRILFDLGAGSHPVRWQSVADILLVDKKTCQKYMAGLVRDGHLALAGNGYMLSDAGMSFLQEINEGENPNYLESGKNPGETFSPLKESVEVVNLESESLTTPPTSQLGKNPGEIFSPDVRLALEHLPMLFDGSEITLNGLPTFLHIEPVLGWIAYVYERRASLHSPCGLLYSKLKDARQLRPYIKYMETPEDFLPLDYLDKIGRYERTCERCQVTFTSLAEDEAHREACLLTRENFADYDDSQPAPACGSPDETITAEIENAWQKVLRHLQSEMPRASFDTWVRGTMAAHFDENGLQVATRNSYARDWLTDRLSEKCRALFGSTVTFHVAVETEA